MPDGVLLNGTVGVAADIDDHVAESDGRPPVALAREVLTHLGW